MEKLIYEGKPYIALFASAYALLFAPKSNLTVSCGMILLFCALYIYKLRSKNRSSQSPRRIRR